MKKMKFTMKNFSNVKNYSYLPKGNFSEGTFIGRVYNPKTKGPVVVSVNKSFVFLILKTRWTSI
jgi:fumarylacetoacetate (FAA) hydrolase family protein